MVDIQALVKAVIKDLEHFDDVEASVHIDREPQTLYATYKDALGFIEYHVPDTDMLLKEIDQEVRDSDITIVDAFWYVLNSQYKK